MEQNKNNGKGRKIIIILICVIVTAAAAIGIIASRLLNSISAQARIPCSQRTTGTS